MPTLLKPENVLDVTPDREGVASEVSDERFDRAEFAQHALQLLRPPRTTVAICADSARMRVESGPEWRRHGERWALLAIPRNASRRAIALAVAELSRAPRAWVLDVLLGVSTERADA